MTVTEFLGSFPKPVRILVALALLAVAGAVDYVVDPAFTLAPLYLIPVSFCAWFLGGRYGVMASLVAAIASLLNQGPPEIHFDSFAWNALMELGMFLFLVFILTQVKFLYEEEKLLSRHDYLTSVLNERAFNELLTAENNRARRYNYPVTLAYLDLDNFKEVNDSFGHAAGDQVLRNMARTLSENIRDSDTVARLGGDEFVVLLPQTDAEAATAVLQKLRSVLDEAMRRQITPVTFSIGVVTYATAPETIQQILERADSLMYRVKGEGKNAMRQEVVGAGD